jgi:recombination protein RecT
MANDLQIFEKQLTPLVSKFQQVLGRIMPAERLMRTVVISAERTPALLECDRQTLFNAAMTFAVLGLEVDGVTGQGFLIPFENRKQGRSVVQPIIGYLGYNTLGARAGMTITGRAVREGDPFEFDEARGVVSHSRLLGGETGPNKRRITAAWAQASAKDRPPIVRVLSADELLAVKAKSPRGGQPPWSDPEIGYPAMCEKTAKRRLRRDMPLNVYQSAARMEEAFEEQGEHSWIHPVRGVMIGGDQAPSNYNDTTPTAAELINPPDLRTEARMAAERGTDMLRVFCRNRLSKTEFAEMKSYLESLRPIAEKADLENQTDT